MTWAAFEKQYQAQGRERAEGYFPVQFDELSPEELERARAMLEARGAAGDTTDLDGLRLIGNQGTAARLAAAGRNGAAHGIAFETARRETLFALTDDPRTLAPLLERTDERDEAVAAMAARALARHPLPEQFSAPLAARFADGRHERPLLWLVKAWLSAQGVPAWDMPVFDRSLPFIRKVTQARPARRVALLAGWRPA